MGARLRIVAAQRQQQPAAMPAPPVAELATVAPSPSALDEGAVRPKK